MPVTATSRLGLVKPLGPDPVQQLRLSIGNLDDMLEALCGIVLQGSTDTRPVSTAGVAGVQRRFYFHTSGSRAGDLDYDQGNGWVLINPSTGVDGPANTGTLRTLGTGALQAAAGTDVRLSDQRVPLDTSVTTAKLANALKPSTGASAATEAVRALGILPGQAAAGDLTVYRTLLDAKGDLFAASGDDTVVRVPVGVDRAMLVARSSAASGVAWDPGLLPVKTVTGNYTMLATDVNSKVRVDSSAAQTVTLPDLGVGFVVNVTRWNTGTVTFAAGSGMTLRSEGGKVMVGKQYQTVSVHQVSATEMQLEGAIG